MRRRDDIRNGCPITRKAIEYILERSKRDENRSYTPISPKLNENEQFFKDAIGVGTSFDLGVRKLNILKTDVHLYYCNGLCDTQYIIELLEMLVQVNDRERQSAKLPEIIENRLVHQQVNPVKSLDEAVDFC